MTTKVKPVEEEGTIMPPADQWIVWREDSFFTLEESIPAWYPTYFPTEQTARHYIAHYWDGEARFKLTKEYPIKR